MKRALWTHVIVLPFVTSLWELIKITEKAMDHLESWARQTQPAQGMRRANTD